MFNAIPFVCLFLDDRRALFPPTVQKALRCWCGQLFSSLSSSTGATAHVRASTTSGAISLSGEPSASPEAGEGFEDVGACASDPDGKAAATVSKAISSTSCNPRSSWDKSGPGGEKHKQTLHGLHDMMLDPPPTRGPGNARRGTHRCSAVRSSQPDLRSLGLQLQYFQGLTGLFTLWF